MVRIADSNAVTNWTGCQEELCVSVFNLVHNLYSANPNEMYGHLELFLVRTAVFLIFLVGLYKVVADTLGKILK